MPLLVEAREAEGGGIVLSKPKIKAGYMAVALQLQEAASGDLSASDTARRISDAVSDAHKGSGNYGYYIDHFGDDDSGDVIYSCNGSTMSCPYEMDSSGGAAKAVLNTDAAKPVKGRTVYEPVADEDDHYAQMEEAYRRDNLYTSLPLYERFISKDERNAADSGDFAGKGKSYPILKPGDVQAAVHAMGRAGSGNYDAGTLKRNIIRIAKKKGWAKYLPQAWQSGSDDDAGDKAKEAARIAVSELRLVECAGDFCQELHVAEAARVNYPIKLISPGTGTMAHYPAPVLEASAGKFKAGTLMFWNHPTGVEEAARPEGDLNNLAAITTKDAEWKSEGPKGPGLYAEAKVMADYAQKVEERAPHIGLSIRAGGKGTGRTVNGKPELASIDYVESVDYVTKAGRGGLALAEAARNAGLLPNPTQEASGMDANELKLLRESLAAQQVTTTSLLEKELRREAIAEGARILRDVALPAGSKEYIIETVLREALPKKDGALDKTKLAEALNTETARFAGAIGATQRVKGMGSAPVVAIDAREGNQTLIELQKALGIKPTQEVPPEDAAYKEAFAFLAGGNLKIAEAAMAGRPEEEVA